MNDLQLASTLWVKRMPLIMFISLTDYKDQEVEIFKVITKIVNIIRAIDNYCILLVDHSRVVTDDFNRVIKDALNDILPEGEKTTVVESKTSHRYVLKFEIHILR